MTGMEPALLMAASTATGTVASTLPAASTAASVLGTLSQGLGMVGQLSQSVQGIRNSRAQVEAQNAQMMRQHQIQLAKQRIEQQRRERQRKSQLASARARLGASGVGSTGGSGAALLGGINAEFDRQQSESDQLFNMSQVRPNLLDDRPQRIRQVAQLGQQIIGMIPN